MGLVRPPGHPWRMESSQERYLPNPASQETLA
jgi:hypothetical protein